MGSAGRRPAGQPDRPALDRSGTRLHRRQLHDRSGRVGPQRRDRLASWPGRPVRGPPPPELSGPVASDDGLESPRAKGCLIAVLAVALVATTGASLLFRPAQHTLVLERPVATEVAVDDEAASGLGPAGDGLVGEGVIAASA